MSFNINCKLIFIHSFQFLNFSLDLLVKNFSKNDLKYLSQKFDNEVSDLVKQRGFYRHSIWVIWKRLKKNLQEKNIFSSLTDKKKVIKSMNMFLNFEIYFK